MKIHIEKTSGKPTVRITLTPSPASKPIVLDVAPSKLEGLVELVKVAGAADQFKFSMEM